MRIKVIDWISEIHDLNFEDIRNKLYEFRASQTHARTVSLPIDHASGATATLLIWEGPEAATDKQLVRAFAEAWVADRG
jgi:hypothetical protein